MKFFSLLTAMMIGGETAEPAELGFFEKIWDTIVKWFIDGQGWLAIVKAALVLVVGLLIIKIILAITRKIINRGRLKGIAGNFIVMLIKIVLIFIY